MRRRNQMVSEKHEKGELSKIWRGYRKETVITYYAKPKKPARRVPLRDKNSHINPKARGPLLSYLIDVMGHRSQTC